MPRAILHVDMDAFFASVEQHDNPSLRGKPVIVGGSAEGRGVVSAASYEAREFGVHSAMPMARAVRLCPQAVVLPGRMARYAEVSQQIHNVFERYTPLVEPLSIDEAFLDVTGSRRLFGSPINIARRIKADILAETGLAASVGVAPNKYLAKIASDLDKPDGLVVVTEEEKVEFLARLPISRVWGVGKVGQKAFAQLRVQTIGDLQRLPMDVLEAQFGNQAEHLRRLAFGQDERPVETEGDAKSIGSETTFARDVADRRVLETTLLTHAETVAWRLRKAGLSAKTVTLKLRYADFSTITRQVQLPEPTDLAETLYETGVRILRTRVALSRREVRLIGLAASGLAPAGRRQLLLFKDEQEEKRRRAAAAVDQVREKLGKAAIVRGALLD